MYVYVCVCNLTGVQASGVIIVYCDSAVSYGPNYVCMYECVFRGQLPYDTTVVHLSIILTSCCSCIVLCSKITISQVSSIIWIACHGIDSFIVSYVFKRIVHPPPMAACIAVTFGAINEILFTERHKYSSLPEVLSF